MEPSLVISAQFFSWCVYVWKRHNPDDSDIVMYVGVSQNGVRRFGSDHIVFNDFSDSDYVELFPCMCKLTAMNLERKFINALKPRLNKFIPPLVKRDEKTTKPMPRFTRKHLLLSINK